MEVPGLDKPTEGLFDCREDIDNIFGNLDFKNKTVLNLGQSTGYLNFVAEERGADVTSIDLDVNSAERDWVPRANEDWKKDLRKFMGDERRRRNAFWYAHKAFNSKSKLIISHINNLPKEVSIYDIGIIFSVLTHIRDPFLALQRMLSHIREKIVITELGGYSRRKTLKNFIPNLFKKIFSKQNSSLITFVPRYDQIASKWWKFSPEALIEMINILGFGKTTVNYHHKVRHDGSKVFFFLPLSVNELFQWINVIINSMQIIKIYIHSMKIKQLNRNILYFYDVKFFYHLKFFIKIPTDLCT